MFVRLGLVADLRFGGSIFGSAVGVEFVEVSDGDSIDVVASDDFAGVLAVG